jgi:hypothetical protein
MNGSRAGVDEQMQRMQAVDLFAAASVADISGLWARRAVGESSDYRIRGRGVADAWDLVGESLAAAMTGYRR